MPSRVSNAETPFGVFDLDTSACSAAGIRDGIPKPVVASVLYGRILDALGGAGHSHDNAASAPAP